MKTILIANLIFLLTPIWQNEISHNHCTVSPDVNRLEKWLSFYDLKLTNFTDSSSVITNHNSSYPYDYSLDTDNLCKAFFIFSSDSSHCIDLDTYSLAIEKDSNGRLISYGGEVDTETSLINLKAKKRTRILFCGTDCWAEEAYWVSNDQVFILGFTRLDVSYFPTIWSYEIKHNCLRTIKYSNPINIEGKDYTVKIRLDSVGFKY